MERNIFLVICGFILSCHLGAEYRSCGRDYVVLRHLSADDDPNNPYGDLNFKPWYHRHEYYDAGEERRQDPTGRLIDDTAWPGEREEFSDLLLRDLK
jgi:hypothetical protein